MNRAVIQSQCGATLGQIKVTDLDFDDDIPILFDFGGPCGCFRCI